jgi:diacylglycerol O-acyltransferase / wax synthase
VDVDVADGFYGRARHRLQLRTGIAMLSYADTFIFGITADYDAAPDIDALAAGIENGVAQLVKASPTRERKLARA